MIRVYRVGPGYVYPGKSYNGSADSQHDNRKPSRTTCSLSAGMYKPMPEYILRKSPAAEMVDWKRRYLQQLMAPNDGMWQSFVDQASHYLISYDQQTVGYCVVNADGKALQFYVVDAVQDQHIFRHAMDELNVVGAFVATSESQYLSLAMDQQKSVSVNALLYQLDDDRRIEQAVFPEQARFLPMKDYELDAAVEFAVETLGADPDWLGSYFTERIEGNELFGLWKNDALIGTGEWRPSQWDNSCADLGMIVSKNHRGQGLATNILRQLIHHCRDHKLAPICSTESGNIPAQNAISRSGFVSHHRILEITF